MTDTQVAPGKQFELSGQEPATADERRILELHEIFIEANKTADTSMLRPMLPAGPNEMTWFNLNESNYVGADHICQLWDMLHGLLAGGPATITETERRWEVVGDMGYVAYMLDVNYDLGNLGVFDTGTRCTDVWRKIDGDWKLVHFHCSNYLAAQMGGL